MNTFDLLFFEDYQYHGIKRSTLFLYCYLLIVVACIIFDSNKLKHDPSLCWLHVLTLTYFKIVKMPCQKPGTLDFSLLLGSITSSIHYFDYASLHTGVKIYILLLHIFY